ncbi:MAG: hypothetical protein ABR567_15615 [Myxococcales bacterium]|nr:hypothetical protein [Myxococcales bacterium]
MKAASLLLAVACGSGKLQGPLVTIQYVASTTLDAQVARTWVSCVSNVGRTHVHPGWHKFARYNMDEAGDRWTISFTDVPVGRQELRVSDANACAENATGAATHGVYVNGVELTEMVMTPGDGLEPGFAFTLLADGSVRP